MKPQMLYILGQPGVGKTSALNEAVKDATYHDQQTEPVPHVVHIWDRRPDACPMIFEIGKRRDGGFGGTDALGYTIGPKVVQWLEQARPSPVIAEGDRLANWAFFWGVQNLGYELTIAYLHVPDAVAQERRDQRGSMQDPRWIRGRITKTKNLIERCADIVVDIDAEADIETVAQQLREQAVFSAVTG